MTYGCRGATRGVIRETGFTKATWEGLLLAFVLVFGLAGGSGCAKNAASGSSGSSGGGGSPGPAYVPHVNMTGNWQFTAAPTHGPLPFSSLSGVVNEDTTQQGSDYSTVSLLPTSTGCYAGVGPVSLQGGVSGAGLLNVSSFEVNGQILAIDGIEDSLGDTFNGTYTVRGGCADGNGGTLAGVRYAALTGSFTGALTAHPGQDMQLELSQDTRGTGMASFLVTGSAAFLGFGCFTEGTLPAGGAGAVSGTSASLTFSTNDPNGAEVRMLGTFDPLAARLTLNSVQVVGGSCPGPLGAAVLTRR